MNVRVEYGFGRYLFGILSALLLAGCAGQATVPEDYFDSRLTQVHPQAFDNIHVILVESIIDPTSMGGLPSVQDHLYEQGVRNVWRFDMMSGGSAVDLADQIRWIQNNHPGSQVMLVGWSAGTTQIMGALKDLQNDHRGVDSVVHLDSIFLNSAEVAGYPQNVGHNVLIYRYQRRPPASLPNTNLYRIPVVCHYSIPTDPRTLDIVHGEILRLAGYEFEMPEDPGALAEAPESGEIRPVEFTEEVTVEECECCCCRCKAAQCKE